MSSTAAGRLPAEAPVAGARYTHLAMTSTTKELLEAALVLPADERAQLARELLASLDGSDENAEEAWRAEVVKRARDVREGRVELVDGEQSFRRIRARLRRP